MSKKEKYQNYPAMSIGQFQSYLTVALEEMVLRDNCFPKVDNFGVLNFSHMQITEEHGCLVTFKDGSSFLLKISDISIPNSPYKKEEIEQFKEDLEEIINEVETEESD